MAFRSNLDELPVQTSNKPLGGRAVKEMSEGEKDWSCFSL
jgi:hypothetical protein